MAHVDQCESPGCIRTIDGWRYDYCDGCRRVILETMGVDRKEWLGLTPPPVRKFENDEE